MAPESRSIRLVLLAAAALVLILVPVQAGWANGGTLRLADIPIGDYRVSVFTDPTPVRPDSLDVSLLILEEGELGVAEGVVVTVSSRALQDQAPGETLPATRGQADDPRYYAAKFSLGAEGPWEITVRLVGPAGEGEASFELVARERGLLGHPLVLTFLAVLPLIGITLWFLREPDGSEAESGIARMDPPASGGPGPAR